MSTSYNTRLQKGGALIEDMRLLVRAWKGDGLSQNEIHAALGKETIARSKDTFIRSFKPRFLEGRPENSWKICRTIEDTELEHSAINQIYYWLTARSEDILYAYATEELYSHFIQGLWDIRSTEVVSWISSLQDGDSEWTHTVKSKVARGMLAALRDFGLLEGRMVKRITPPNLLPQTACLIAWLLQNVEGVSSNQLSSHDDWKLFFLSSSNVERLFLEGHQLGLLNYQAAGSTVRVEFPTNDLDTYARKFLTQAV